MAARVVFDCNLRCGNCKKDGKITISEFQHPNPVSGNGRRIRELSEGFDQRGDQADGYPAIYCRTCDLHVSY